ncbi:MAG TPA: DUF202 domain-containing protein [Candidatus Elarobacter sp.]|jgi:putative membrane protein|nr:DUF202 domain-containing protein [Candidatus Elarobacter sp.]
MRTQPREVTVEPTVRDHLANERTFLAYVRTALAMIGFGFVISRIDPRAVISLVAGVMMVVGGIAMALFGAYRYVAERRALIEHRWHTLRPNIAIGIAVASGLLGLLAMYALIRLATI